MGHEVMSMWHRVESIVCASLAVGLALSMGSASADVGTEGGADSWLPAPQPAGLLQVWATAWDQDGDPATDPAGYGDPEDDLGFKIRRARVGLEGTADDFRYSLLLGMAAPYDGVVGGGDEISLVDANGAARLVDGLWLSLGLQRVPVSREMLINAGNLALNERSMSTVWLAPGRDVGLVLDGSRGGESLNLRVQAGVFNGNNDPLGDDDPGVLTSLRVDLSKGSGSLASTYGTVEGPTVGIGLDGWHDQSFSTRSIGAGADMMLRAGSLSVLAEGRFSRIEPHQGSDIEPPEAWVQTDRIGGLLQVGYSVGAWEPAVRVSTFDDSRGADDNGDIADALAGVTWHGQGDTIRIGCGYVKRLELSGANLSNDTARVWFQTQL